MAEFGSRWSRETIKAFSEMARALGVDSITICGTEHQVEGDDMGDPNTGEIYQGTLRNQGDVPLTKTQADELNSLTLEQRKLQLQELARARNSLQPDLRTLEGQLSFLDYHAPSLEQQAAHARVNEIFQVAWSELAAIVPAGPGQTRLLHAMQNARMISNCVIANHGA